MTTLPEEGDLQKQMEEEPGQRRPDQGQMQAGDGQQMRRARVGNN